MAMVRASKSPLHTDRVEPRNVFTAKDKGQGSSPESRRSHHTEIAKAGDAIRESGIYEVLHDGEHRPTHEAVMIADDLFPVCDVCEDRVRYRVVRTAPYIFSDEDFEEPQG
jgi:hypothetical protein